MRSRPSTLPVEPRLNLVLGDRPRRVMMLLAAIVVLSLVDLVITIIHLRSVGMVEANPLAAYLIRTTGSWWALVLYKSATVAVCVLLLHRARRHIQGEVASWLALVILVGVSIMWHCYMRESESPEVVRIAQAVNGDEWLMLD